MKADPKKKKLKKVSITKVQSEFNKLIRIRDGKCVTCGSTEHLQASHFFAKGGSCGLRFDPDNVHAQCAKCHYDWHHRNTVPYTEYISSIIDLKELESRIKVAIKTGEPQKRELLRLAKTEGLESIKEYIKTIRIGE